MQQLGTDMKHFICSNREGVCVCVCACVAECVSPRGALCQWGSAERLLGEDPPVKWSSSPRWVSNSLNPTGQRAGLCLAAAPRKPGFPLLLPPLAPFQLPSAYLTSPLSLSPPPVSLCLSFQKSSKKLMRLGWRLSSPLSPCVCGVCLCGKQSPG